MLISELDATRPESHYLLGRAYMLLRQYRGQSEPDPIEQAYNAYQQAVYFDGCCNILWMSVGLLYFHANQRRDALDAMARSIRLYPYEPLVWRNLGLLVSSTLNGDRRSVWLIIVLFSTTSVGKKNMRNLHIQEHSTLVLTIFNARIVSMYCDKITSLDTPFLH